MYDVLAFQGREISGRLPQRHLQLGGQLFRATQPESERRRRRDFVLEEPPVGTQLSEVRISR